MSQTILYDAAEKQQEYIQNDEFGNVFTYELNGESYYKCFKPTANENPFFCFIKRTFDVVLSAIMLLLLIVPMLVVGVVIRIDSKGSVIYRQERLGKNGKEFMMVKFRSMRTDAEAHGPRQTDVNDDRVTKVGRFIRKTRIDELPQLWNILMGDMSFVGPRPERKFYYDKYSAFIDGFDYRLMVKPGLTGYAQVNGGYDLHPWEKVSYDIEYIKKQSALMDIKCVFKTFSVIFTHDGAR